MSAKTKLFVAAPLNFCLSAIDASPQGRSMDKRLIWLIVILLLILTRALQVEGCHLLTPGGDWVPG